MAHHVRLLPIVTLLVALSAAPSSSLASDLSLSYLVDRPDWAGPASVVARLDDGATVSEILIAECEAVSLYEISQNQLLTDLTCDGDLIAATLNEFGIEFTFHDQRAGEIILPDGEYWINGMPLLVGG